MNRVPNVVLSTALFPYLEDEELAKLKVCSRFQRLIAPDTSGRSQITSGTLNPEEQEHWKKPWLARFLFRMKEFEKKPGKRRLFCYLAINYLVGSIGLFLIAKNVIEFDVRVSDWKWSIPLVEACIEGPYLRIEKELEVIAASGGPPGGWWKENAKRMWEREAIQRECYKERDYLVRCFLARACIGFPIIFGVYKNSRDSSAQRQSLALRIMNIAFGVASVWADCLPKIQEDETPRGLGVSAGAWFVLKGILPQHTFDSICGTVAEKTHALGIWTLSKAKQCFRSLKNLFSRYFSRP